MGKKAKVWTYYTAVVAKGRTGEELKAAQCTLCKATVLTKDYTTGPMIGHLEAHHMDEFHVVRADIDAKKAAKVARDKARDVANAKAGVHAPIPTVRYKKIPKPSPTRWNSHEMMISGVCDLEAALVRASQDKDFAGKECKIPTAEQFNLLRSILPTLTLIRRISEMLSADETTTMDQALLQIYLLREKVTTNLEAARRAQDETGLASFLEVLLNQLDQRFVNCGASFHHYALGHYLHPYYKGILLKRVPTPCFDETVHEIIEEHPSTGVYRQKSLENAAKVQNQSLTDAVDLIDEDEDVNQIFKELNQSVLTQQKQDVQDATAPPIRNEIESFQKKIVLDPSVNVLQWWSLHKTEFPLLSAMARSVYCQPASSASSERAFSQAGLTLTSKRQRMSVSTLEKLCFVNQNFALLAPMVKKWKTATDEEEGEPLVSDDDDDEEESVHEIMEASQLESSVPPWVGFREREKSKKRAASPDPDAQLVIDLDSAPPSGSSTPMAKRRKGGKGKVKSSSQASQASQSLLGDESEGSD